MGSRHVDWVPPDRFDEYRLVQALGRGSMGQVWLAHDTVLDRLVAVKFIAERSAHDAGRERFLIEARAAARVQHPNIIAVYRVGEIGPRPYLVSEYVRGNSLDKLAKPVAWPRLRELSIGLARGLAAAHRQGVLHRDLKPANAIVSETGEVKLLDFGLAKLLPLVAPLLADASPDHAAQVSSVPGGPMVAARARSEPFASSSEDDARTIDLPAGALATLAGGSITLPEATPPGLPRARAPSGPLDLLPSATSAGAVMGTPAYMPPEAWRGEPATPCSDVYSLGALLYALGAGAPPHRSDTPEVARDAVLAGDAPPLATAAPGINPGFAAVVDRCLRRDPAERFATGDAVLAALEALATGNQAVARVRARRPQARPFPRGRWAIMVGAVLVLALALLGGQRFREEPAGATVSCPAGMVRVPAGTFQMGSPAGQGNADEQPAHEVTLSAYCIDRTEVTVAAYAVCVAAGGCDAATLTVNWTNYSQLGAKQHSTQCNRLDRPDHPINCVDWDQAAAYCRWTGKRLPTEAEWEYAARGNDGRVYPWGAEPPGMQRLNARGQELFARLRRENAGVPGDFVDPPMYDGNDGWDTTAPVGRYPGGASPFGALDMAGNVWEWTASRYGPYSKRAQDAPQGPDTGTSRVSRGGGWATFDASKVTVTHRRWLTPITRDCDLGFRCARGP
jgi:formylglycine-generating enzyme required for sulfatase activity